MAYGIKKMIALSLEVIEKHKLVFSDDIFAYVPFSRATFYNKELEKLDAIKDALYANKVKMKQGMKAKWYKSENATLQVALYKLIGTDEEAHRLNGSHQKIDQKSEVTTYTPEEREAKIKELKEKIKNG